MAELDMLRKYLEKAVEAVDKAAVQIVLHHALNPASSLLLCPAGALGRAGFAAEVS